MMKIMLLGRYGQVAWELRRTLAPLGEIVNLGRKELNLEEEAAIREAIEGIKPDVIVNAAAYTAVDRAEEEPRKARLINAIAPGILAEEAKRCNAMLVHYSTDYVFNGAKKTPYTEDDQTGPINVYGQTKLEGEEKIRAAGVSHLILRTSWVYGARGNNFLLTMLRLARERDELCVVDDQLGSPTWCRMVAETTALLIFQIKKREDHFTGTYHLSAGGETSWYGFAKAIFNQYFSSEYEHARLIPISTSAYETKAKRPANCVLSCAKLEKQFNISLPSWEHSFMLVMENLDEILL